MKVSQSDIAAYMANLNGIKKEVKKGDASLTDSQIHEIAMAILS